MSHPTTRRTVLAGAAGISAATLLAACGSDEAPPVAAPPQPSAETLGNVNDIPVSGGIIYADRDVIVTQPSLAALRPEGRVMCLETMRYNDEVVPVEDIEGIPGKVEVNKREVETAEKEHAERARRGKR